MVNIMLFKSEPGVLRLIRQANAVSDYASRHGFPTRQTLGPVVRLKGEHITKYAGLYNYLPGTTIPWEGYTMKHIKLLGKTMGDLHAALSNHTVQLPSVAGQSLALQQRMQWYFADPNVRTAVTQKLGLRVPAFDFTTAIQTAARLPGQQPLHMDFVRSNILFDGEGAQLAISGILDFEKTASGHALFDVARTLAFLLVDCKYKPEEKIRKYFLLSGYNKRGSAQPVTRTHLLEPLLNFYLLHDFYKFLRHNPYEYLPQNEHFIRTRDLLQARHIIE